MATYSKGHVVGRWARLREIAGGGNKEDDWVAVGKNCKKEIQDIHGSQ